ncbi:MAG TPA: metallophosphoesterase [Flavisolibacter sp.]
MIPRIVFFIITLINLMACNPGMHKARIVLLPDTQTYAEKYPEVLDSQIHFLLQEQKNIQLVLQQGDLTQNNNDREWDVIKKAFSKLDNKIPYVLAAGNHDMGSGPGKFADVRNSTLFNRYFPIEHMSRLPLFGGAYEQEKMDNVYYFMKTGKIKWIIFSLEFGPRNSVLNWADKIISKHQDKIVIINTHSYMFSDSTRQGPGDSWRPQSYGVGKDKGDSSVNDGEQIWEKLVRKHPNVRFVFSGHVLNKGVGTLLSINDAGHPVYQMLANYQEGVKGSVQGGNGWLRIIEMDFKKKTVQVRTYSPYIKQYMEQPAHDFIIRHVVFKND